MPPMTVTRLDERWTPTTIRTTFRFRPPSLPVSGGISVALPLLNLGWTFALSLTPQKRASGSQRPIKRVCSWIPAAFSLRQHGSTIPWGDTSIRAKLTLLNDTNDHSTSLGEICVGLANTPSFELPLATSCIFSSTQSYKVWLAVTVSECPLVNGLFSARSGPVDETELQEQLVRQCGDRVLNQSLTTGKLFDVKFLAFPARPAPGIAEKPLPLYASLSVVEKHVNLSASVLKEGWENALAALDDNGSNHVREVLCPKDHEYELDGDLEDEDEALSPPCDPGSELDLAISKDQQLDTGTEGSSSSLSSFELEGVDSQLEELLKCAEEPTPGYERTIWVKFAAHRTWHAFLWYCYTGKLELCKLKSQVETGNRHLRVTPLDGGPPVCSPKSMYRLADLLGNEDLKAMALAAIRDRMTETNVLDEAFSVFTSRYPDVREAQLGALMERCSAPKVKEAFLRAMERYGSMPHAKPVLSAFFNNLVE